VKHFVVLFFKQKNRIIFVRIVFRENIYDKIARKRRVLMEEFLVKINSLIWGAPMIILILGIGIILTIGCRMIQIRRLPLALKYMVKNEEGGQGDVTSFQALCTALSATIGTGNIVGVATAIVAGGPGALFWLELAGLLGMATKYAEGLLAVKYRTFDDHGKA
jgi:AGCS family alanine or glycine:cation symporter